MTIQGSEPLDFKKANEKGFELLEKGDKFGFMIICGVNFGLRISDLLGVSYDDLKSGKFVACERKTGKKRIIVVNQRVQKALEMVAPLDEVRYSLGGSPWISRKNTVMSVQQVNRKIKRIFGKEYSSHGMRKAFGRRLFEAKDKNLAIVQMQLQHSDPEHTLRYIGVRQEELNQCFHEL